MNIKMKWTALAVTMALSAPAFAQSQSLPSWDQLSDAQRDVLSAPVKERWDANPERRAKMMEHATKWASMTPEQRKAAMKGRAHFGKMSPERREAMRAVFYKAQSYTDKAQRKSFLEGIRKMTPEQRAAWVKANPVPEGAKVDMPRKGRK